MKIIIFDVCTLSQFQPNIKEGGRANTIAVNPVNDNIILVASESGGLFRSINRGLSWSHVDTLPAFAIAAVVFLPADPNIVIATTVDDFRVNNGGGIWRSVDGGLTWAQIPSPPAPPSVKAVFKAGEISIAPDTGDIFVATNYGVSVGVNNGASWDHRAVFSSLSVDTRVASVLALGANLVLAGGPAGVRRSPDGGSTWLDPVASPGNVNDMHAFGRSPFVQDQAYVVNAKTELYYTEDGGDKWKKIASAPAGNVLCGGIAFVKPIGYKVQLADLMEWGVDLYFGNHCDLLKLRCPSILGTNRFNYSFGWKRLNLDHLDTRDLAFDNSKHPLLLATDGGLHNTVDGGLNWKLVGGGRDGFNALQITEVKGQRIQDTGRYDLYFGTQDNYFWCSGDGGLTWHHEGSEGGGIEALHRVPTSSDSIITYDDAGAGKVSMSESLLSNVKDWPNPPNRMRGSLTECPKILGGSFHVQAVNDSDSFKKGFVATFNLGKKWQQYVEIPEDCFDLPKISRDPTPFPQLVLYQSIRTGYDHSRNFDIFHLARIVQPYGGGATVSYPKMKAYLFSWDKVPGSESKKLVEFLAQRFSLDWIKTAKIEKIEDGRTIKMSTEKNYLKLKLNEDKTEANLLIDDERTETFSSTMESGVLTIYFENLVAIGLNSTMFCWYAVFGVDPDDINHIIAPDVINEMMMETWDGGNNWSEISQLTSLVTEKGQFRFRVDIRPHASAISFSPDDPNMVAVGTWQGGIFVSKDRGATWQKVPDSERVTRVTSFEWRTSTDIIVSTYGRGLWRIRWTANLPRRDFKAYCKACKIGPPARTPEQLKWTHAILVSEGRIQGIRVSNGVLREVFVWPGTCISFLSDSKTAPDLIVKETTKRLGFRGVPKRYSPLVLKKSANIVGVVLGTKDKLVGVVFSDEPLSMHRVGKKHKKKEILWNKTSPIANKPCLHVNKRGGKSIVAGELINLSGMGFRPGILIEITLDGHSAQEVTVGREGTFSTTVEAPHELGLHSIIARDARNAQVVDGTNIFVIKPREYFAIKQRD